MKRVLTLATVAVVGAALLVPSTSMAAFQKSKKKAPAKAKAAPYTGPESSLVGVKIYDSALRVINLYGNPDTIKAVSVGSTSAGGGGGGQGGGGGFGGRGGDGGGVGRPTAGADQMLPGENLPGGLIPGGPIEGPSDDLRQAPRQGGDMGGDGGGPGRGGPPGVPGAGGPGGPGAPGGGGLGGGSSEASVFTRWTYTRNGTKLSFVIDKFNRVVQIEAIGLQNQRVKTRRGIGFGSTFGSVMKAYAPTYDADGYDIGANNFTIRFLTRGRVAFRLSKLANKSAHVVTGIVVAAGKQ